MSIIRTDEQADALEILKLIIETADLYRAMGELLTQDNINHPLFDIAREREAYITPFQKVVKSLGELPARPDSDKELVEEIAGKITQLLSVDYENAVFEKCLKKDAVLADVIDKTTLGEQSPEIKTLLDSLNNQLSDAQKRLSDN
ncbi:MAG: hypothetical protein R3341_01770 [Methylophaga sp.]|nr:hypothetical protein [Methylophaga sp.]